MGKKRKKSGAGGKWEIDNSATKEIVLDIEHRTDDYDDCNALVLPSKKRSTKNVDKNLMKVRLLSKKRRKELEKVVERKKKKLQRATLLEELSKVQASSAELEQYVGLTTVQNKGLKRYFRELEAPVPKKVKHEAEEEEENEEEGNDDHKIVLNSIKGSNKKRLAILNSVKQSIAVSDPNIVGFKDSSSSSDSDDDPDIPDKIVTPEVAMKEKLQKNETQEEDLKKNVENKKMEADKPQELEKPIKEVTKVQQENTAQVHIPTVFVPVNRTLQIQAARLKLPILAEEQIIIEMINENPIVLITGETGSGKTTQVPQFLYEAGYAQKKMIGITEPRRVAAMSMSKRVAEEMNLTKKEISYLIRFEGNVTEDTKIKFMTDGVLLKEIQSDFLLTKYSVIILDEAHERSVHTDVLIGFLSRIVPLREKRNDALKLIIMSATLRVEEFVENTNLFKVKPPVITIEARQFPVTIYFSKRTKEDYMEEALRKAVNIHTRLPEGGILIFLTGQQEVDTVVRKLRKAFPLEKNKQRQTKPVNPQKSKTVTKEATNEEFSEEEEKEDDNFDALFERNANEALHRNKQRRKKKQLVFPIINLDDYSMIPTDDAHEDLVNAQDDKDNLENEDDEDFMDFMGISPDAQPLWVLPLYSLLPSHEQAKVFQPPPEGCRLCVVSTNIAETSLTIPNIRYVVDSGRCKVRMYDKLTGVSTYQICYASKAAASQRAGRAGRTGPGYCYRLYSSAVYNDEFAEYGQPEIQRRPLDDLVLQLKSMNIPKIVNFPFPTPPDIEQLKTAEKRLMILGALQPPTKQEGMFRTKVTPLGHSIASFPVSPRFGKMLALSEQHGLFKYTISIVAALSVQQMLIETPNMKEDPIKNKWLQLRQYVAGAGNSLLLGDPMVLLKTIGAAEYADSTKKELISFCEKYGLRHKAVMEIRKLRQQLTNEINLNIPTLNLSIDFEKISPPDDTDANLLRQIILAGMVDQVAKKVLPFEMKDKDREKWMHAYKTPELEEPVFMHFSCVLRKTRPEWVVYQEVYETNKMYMRGVTAIEPEWLPKFAPTLCNLSEPLSDPPPRYDREIGKIICRVTGTFGRAALQLPLMDVEHPATVNGVKWFACFFLQGQVCPKLARFVPLLLNTPDSIIKPWAKLIPRTQAITQPLMSRGIISKDKLLKIWDSDKTFLLAGYQKWLPVEVQIEVALLWPPL